MAMIAIGMSWLIGMWATFTFDLRADGLAIAAVLPVVMLLLWRDVARVRAPALIALMVVLGALRAAVAQPVFDVDDVATYNDRGLATFTGVVADYPDRRDQSVNLRVEAQSITPRDSASITVSGLVLVRAPRLPEFRYGDRIEVTGELQAPPEFATFN